MQEEIEKMSDEILLCKLLETYCDDEQDIYYKIKQELLKRLSNNNIEEFKKRLVKNIKDFRILLLPYQSMFGEIKILHGGIRYNPKEIMCEEIENLINNVGKEK